jgi:glycosyltransferase involved in cell wall biosynthesis
VIDEQYSLVIGGLRRKKGAYAVLQVANELYRQRSDFRIVIAGESEADFIDAVREHPNITLLGKVSDRDLPVLLRCASSLLFLSPYEGFGIPALESMAAGTPAVVSNCAALPETVGDAGIVVSPTETAEIVDILLELSNNSSLREEYSLRGQKHASQYTWSKCVNRLNSAFKDFA